MNLDEHTSVAYASVILRSESFCSIIDICSLSKEGIYGLNQAL